MISHATVIHHDCGMVGLDFLRAHHDVQAYGQQELGFSGEVDAIGPEILLFCQARAVEHACLQDDRKANVSLVGYLRAHVTHIAYLLGDERAIGEVLLVWRAMRVNGEGHSLLAYGELETLPRL